jgi:hypothetical protein
MLLAIFVIRHSEGEVEAVLTRVAERRLKCHYVQRVIEK